MKYVILGSSAAGVNAVREICRLDKTASIILISKDQHIYSRCILHHYLGNIRNLEQLSFVEKDFVDRYSVEWISGVSCTGLNTKENIALLEDGQEISYDKLLIATGAHTFIPPIKNIEHAKNVFGFRNLEDARRLKEIAKTANHIVILGAGLVGLDVASGLEELGVKSTVIEFADHLLPKQLNKRAAAAYEEAFTKAGVIQYYGKMVKELVLDENHKVKALTLNDGAVIPCGCLVITAGVRANVEFLEGTGVEVDKFGLVLDRTGRTNIPNIYGAGDVSGRSPIWPAAVKEGIVAASNMASVPQQLTDFFDSKATMNFMGIPTMSLGNPEAPDESYEIEEEESKDIYKKIIHKNGKITGAILQGDLSYGGVLQQLIANRIDVSKVKKSIFDVDYSDFFNVKANFEYFYEEVSNG